jgi:lipid A biosynthesis (KDO)2-(lauroyl)-lipid IVA acyltransferase
MNDNSSQHQSRYLPSFTLALLAPRYWLIWLLLFAFYVFSWLPISVIDRIAGALGDYAVKKNRKRMAIVQRNLQLCFPHMTADEVDVNVRAHFRAYIRSILHYGLIWWAPGWRLRRHVELHGAEQIQHYRAQGKNIIALTCHSVGLEFSVIALSMRELCGGPYKPMKNPLIDWLVAKGRMQNRARIFTREEGLRPLVRNTREGRVLIYLADEDLGAEVSVFAPFFGVQKATIPVLGRLAKTCNAIVLPCISCYDEQSRKYIVKLMPALQNFPQGDDLADATNMNQAIEQAVLECVPQYFWTMKWFRSRPPGEPEIYN